MEHECPAVRRESRAGLVRKRTATAEEALGRLAARLARPELPEASVDPSDTAAQVVVGGEGDENCFRVQCPQEQVAGIEATSMDLSDATGPGFFFGVVFMGLPYQAPPFA